MEMLRHILLVDDDLMDQELFMAALSSVENVTLDHIAKNGKEALAALEHCPTLPAIIFMDVDMPVMGGIECLEQIMLNPKTRDIPVVMLSSTVNQQQKTAKIGARGFIVKPDNAGTLVVEIRGAVRNFV